MSLPCRALAWLRSLVWFPVCEEDVPRWVLTRIGSMPDRLYDRRVYLKGKHYIWRVDGVMMGQGMVQHHYARRLRRRHR